MSKKIGIIAAVCLVLTLCFAFVGCGPNVDKSLYAGEWELQSGSTDSLDADTIALTKSLGSNVILTLNEDGTGSFDLFGEVDEVTWSASSDTEGTVKIGDSNEAKMTLSDGSLDITDATGGSLTFERV